LASKAVARFGKAESLEYVPVILQTREFLLQVRQASLDIAFRNVQIGDGFVLSSSSRLLRGVSCGDHFSFPPFVKLKT
jgi:hypothetical protein